MVRRFKVREKGRSSMLRGAAFSFCYLRAAGHFCFFFALLSPGDGGAGEAHRVAALPYPPEESAFGEGMGGLGGRGTPLRASQRPDGRP